MPDGGIDEDELAERLTDLVPDDAWCVATWRGDGHPDHEAVGRAAARVSTRLLEYPVWAWHWSRPDDHRVPWSTALRLDLPPAVAEAKRRAARAYASQVEPLGPDPADAPILPPPVLARLTRGYEVLFG
ncbi:PIG-L deacetylase family protein [Actinokineospora sp. G85]|uniref:PIG-L deacetylase family protein n=1 Tax=Actinokineospora sp. G85 TaxID=3406626 RepID=UPI003C77BD26